MTKLWGRTKMYRELRECLANGYEEWYWQTIKYKRDMSKAE